MGWGGERIDYTDDSYDRNRAAERESRERERDEGRFREIYRDAYGRCVHCDKDTERRLTYCVRCGKRWDVADPVVEERWVCPNGHGESSGSYCGVCGSGMVRG